MLGVTGRRTTIIQELESMIDEPIVRIDMDLESLEPIEVLRIPPARRFVLAAGVLHQKRILWQSQAELMQSLAVNLVNVVRLCEAILGNDESARICVIGSESGSKGCWDETYAIAKGGLESYVRWRKMLPRQQLTLVAPPIIADSGMTRRRHDYPQVLRDRRTVTARQVAEIVKDVLYAQPTGFTTIERMA